MYVERHEPKLEDPGRGHTTDRYTEMKSSGPVRWERAEAAQFSSYM